MFIGGGVFATDAAVEEFITLNNIHVYMNGMDLSTAEDNRYRGLRIGGGIVVAGTTKVHM